MRIAIVSKSDSNGGGASRVAEELSDGLNRCGHPSVHFSAESGKGYGSTHRSLSGPRLASRLTLRAHRFTRRLGLTEGFPFELPAMIASGIARDFDIVHFHDLSTAISPWTVRWFSSRRPTFWTFHDCSPFTGGCIFPMDCERFKTRCGSAGGCPQLHRWPIEAQFDLTGLMQSVKTSLHRAGRVHTLAPSEWLANVAFSSGKVVRRPRVVPNGVDLVTFRPADRRALREALGLPFDRPIVLVTAGFLLDPRKGVQNAFAAIAAVADRAPFVVVVGGPIEAVPAFAGPLDHRAVGYVSDPEQLARWYAVADVAINASLAESQGLTVLETMACGVPMVAFASGGVPEMIIPDETGWLTPPLDVRAMAVALRHALDDGVAAKAGHAARRRAEESYAFDAFVCQHVELYARALHAAATGGCFKAASAKGFGEAEPR